MQYNLCKWRRLLKHLKFSNLTNWQKNFVLIWLTLLIYYSPSLNKQSRGDVLISCLWTNPQLALWELPSFMTRVNKYPKSSQFVVAFDKAQTCHPPGDYQQLNLTLDGFSAQAPSTHRLQESPPAMLQPHPWGVEDVVCAWNWTLFGKGS